MQDMTSGLGMVPEQAWEDPAVAASPFGSDPATASIGFANGKPAGSASPLIWAQAQYLRLVTDLGSGSLGDQPAIVADRYVRHAPPASLTVTATATAAGGQITVSGTARAGSTVVISAGQPTASSDTTAVVSTVAGPDGHFRATVPLRPGTNVITATASRRGRDRVDPGDGEVLNAAAAGPAGPAAAGGGLAGQLSGHSGAASAGVGWLARDRGESADSGSVAHLGMVRAQPAARTRQTGRRRCRLDDCVTLHASQGVCRHAILVRRAPRPRPAPDPGDAFPLSAAERMPRVAIHGDAIRPRRGEIHKDMI